MEVDLVDRISSCFEKYNYKTGDNFICRISHTYDLSKFWIITKYREYEYFQSLLNDHYNRSSENLKMPEEEIAVGIYCLVCAGGEFHRVKVLGFPLTGNRSVDLNQKQVQILYVDSGLVDIEVFDNIYKLKDVFADTPKFAIRASLAGICPFEKHTWSLRSIDRFNEIHLKDLLEAVVVNSDRERQIVEIKCRRREPRGNPINEILIMERLAQPFVVRDETVEVNPILANSWGGRSTLKYPYLFPTHEMLESGKIVTSVKALIDISPNIASIS